MDIITHKLINILIELAKADNHLADEELELIYEIADARGFKRKQVDWLIENSEPIGTLGALSLHQKFEYLYQAILIIKADQEIHPKEVIFCQNLAVKMGLRKSVIDFLINEVTTGQNSIRIQKLEKDFNSYEL